MTILIIDDEPQIRRVLRVMLQAQGYHIVEAATGADGLVFAFTTDPDCILLDISLPDLQGIDVLQSIRRQSDVPVIILTIHEEEQQKVRALDLGADDYVTKPFGARELMARIRVALRHRASTSSPAVIQVGPVIMDFERRLVERHGEPVRLTPIEYDLLRELASNLGRVLTHRHLLQQVWGDATDTTDAHYLRIYIGHLRKKIEDDPARPQLIITEPGVGYRMTEPE
ncbi:MAG: DNA-binding response regulator [Sulfobacillus benefaciens]|uniref:Stage 0 sporulation protein A homolog n=1 Tax=Sulfobacillus benefaciens TaxID=453960 RepID=A0A2T2XDD8_9FIRM|nr:MAG: DNA-binding response regulator [Sulfobacillus benefaciens]